LRVVAVVDDDVIEGGNGGDVAAAIVVVVRNNVSMIEKTPGSKSSAGSSRRYMHAPNGMTVRVERSESMWQTEVAKK